MAFLTTPINSMQLFSSSSQQIKSTITQPNLQEKLMGNCVEAFRNSPSTAKNHNEEEEEREVVVESGEKSKVRIKIVLRKEEVEWLMCELQQSQSKKIDEILWEIQRSREKTSVAWKPSLDSILESPEIPHRMLR